MSSICKLLLSVIVLFTLAADPASAQTPPSTTTAQAPNDDQVDLTRANPNNNNSVTNSTNNLTGSGVESGTSDTSLHGTGEARTTGPFGGTDNSATGNAYRGWWIGGIVLAGLVAAFVLFNLWRKPDTYSADLRSRDEH